MAANLQSLGDSDSLPRRPMQLEETEMDITPMIDCTFLLLIFFLVCSRPDPGSSVSLPPAKFGVAVPAKDSAVLTISDAGGGVANIYKGDGKVQDNLLPAGDMLAQEEEVTKFVDAELHTAHPKKHHVLIKAEKGVKHRDVARVAKAAARAPDVGEFHIAIMEVSRDD